MSLGSDYLRSLLEEDPERGVYRCKREMFTDPRLRKPCAGAPSADRHGVQESASDPQATDIPSSTRYLT